MHFNKNHDKLGRFTFGDGNGDGVIGKADPNSYRTPELDKKYSELEKTGIIKDLNNSNLKWIGVGEDESKWGNDVAKSVKLGVEAMRSLPEFDWFDPGDYEERDVLSSFLLSDWSEQNAYPEAAYLASKGYSVKQIADFFRSASDMHDKNEEYFRAYTGYPDNDDYHKYSDKAYDTSPYQGIYNMADRATMMHPDSNGDLYKFTEKCVELAKNMEHSDMSGNYLEHFNPNHDPKTGQFTFAVGGGARENYDGKKKSVYAKEMAEQYRQNGYSKLRSRAMGYAAANANRHATKQYNLNLRKNQRAAQKYEEAKLSGDQKKVSKYSAELFKSYTDTKITEELLNQPYAIGKDWYNREIAQLIGGIPLQMVVANRPDGLNSLYKEAKNTVLSNISSNKDSMHKLLTNEMTNG